MVCCQLESKNYLKLLVFLLFFISFVSCSGLQEKTSTGQEARPWWFNGEKEEYQAKKYNGKIRIHRFFDFKPNFDFVNKNVFFIPLTSKHSHALYELDFTAGAPYARFPMCSQQDAWSKKEKIIKNPTFTYGIIPRSLDSIKDAQKIIVFGNAGNYQIKDEAAYKVKVIGGIVEEICPENDCRGKTNWKKRIILVGVNPNDPAYNSLVQMKELKEKEEWNEFIDQVQNFRGQNILANKAYPAFRVIGDIEADAALKYIKDNNVSFGNKNLISLRNSCHKLYDFSWKRFKDFFIRPDFSNKSVKKLIVYEKQLGSFPKYWVKFFKKYGEEFTACSRYVWWGDVVDKTPAVRQKFWILTYFINAMNLIKERFYFSCNQRTWQVNPIVSKGVVGVDPFREISTCNLSQFNSMFETVVRYWNTRRNAHRKYMRFIEYDSGFLGSHNKFFTLTKVPNKYPVCARTKAQTQLHEFLKQIEIWPKDIKWPRLRIIEKKKHKNVIF